VHQHDAYRLRAPASDAEWVAYHTIRRVVLFERRGQFGVYDASHPDETCPENHPFLLLFNGEPVGTIRVDITFDEAIFRRVAIREDVQRRGHGRVMMSLAEHFARSQGKNRIRSHVDASAVGFYERCGYSRAQPESDGATVLMTKELG
jgi:GNAT superfamily N-acetyltransferase